MVRVATSAPSGALSVGGYAPRGHDDDRPRCEGVCVEPDAGASGGRRHAAALLSAISTLPGALLAVLRLVLLALGRAGVTNHGAHLADLASEAGIARKKRRGETTDGGALSVEPDAFAHHLDPLFAQTGGGAMVASVGAGVTGGEAARILGMGHGRPDAPIVPTADGAAEPPSALGRVGEGSSAVLLASARQH